MNELGFIFALLRELSWQRHPWLISKSSIDLGVYRRHPYTTPPNLISSSTRIKLRQLLDHRSCSETAVQRCLVCLGVQSYIMIEGSTWHCILRWCRKPRIFRMVCTCLLPATTILTPSEQPKMACLHLWAVNLQLITDILVLRHAWNSSATISTMSGDLAVKKDSSWAKTLLILGVTFQFSTSEPAASSDPSWRGNFKPNLNKKKNKENGKKWFWYGFAARPFDNLRMTCDLRCVEMLQRCSHSATPCLIHLGVASETFEFLVLECQ